MEARKDKYWWGANATLNSNSVFNTTWKGARRMGIQLMVVPTELQRNHAGQMGLTDQSNSTLDAVDPQGQTTN